MFCVLKKSIKGIAAVTSVTMCMSVFFRNLPLPVCAAEDTNSVSGSQTEILYTKQISYGDYFDEYISVPFAEEEVVIRGTDYFKA